jgi:carbon storage regulator
MLVLKRRPGQSLVIGDDVEIQILELSATRVKLGISAPDSVSVVRKEVVLTRQQNLSASQAVSPDVLSWLSRGITGGVTVTTDRQEIDTDLRPSTYIESRNILTAIREKS